MTEFRVPDIPALRVFDPKATRWAVVRGLLRTAFVVLSFLLVGAVLLGLGVRGLSNALDRPEQMARMVAAYKVAHPGLDVGEESSKLGGWHQTATLSGRPGDAGHDVRLSLSIFGVLETSARKEDALDDLLGGTSWPKRSTEIFLGRLGGGVTVDGVVVFAQPVRMTGPFFSEPDWQGATAVFYTAPFASAFGSADQLRTDMRRPVSWGTYGTSFDTFADWAAHLGSGDDPNLDRLGLPSSRELRELAGKGEATGFYVRGLAPSAVARLLKDPRIASFTPSAVQYDLSMPQ